MLLSCFLLVQLAGIRTLYGMKLQLNGQLLLSVGILASFGYGLYRHYERPPSASQPEAAVDTPDPEPVKTEQNSVEPAPSRDFAAPKAAAARSPENTTSEQSVTPTFTPPRNPYQELSKQYGSPNTTSMREAFGSINRDSVKASEAVRNNAYFKTLSKQLKDMQQKQAERNSAKSDEAGLAEDSENALNRDIQEDTPNVGLNSNTIVNPELPNSTVNTRAEAFAPVNPEQLPGENDFATGDESIEPSAEEQLLDELEELDSILDE